MLPEIIWNIAKDKLNTTYGTSWCGLKCDTGINLVSQMKTDQNHGRSFNKVENTDLYFMKDTGHPFLSINATMLHLADESISNGIYVL